MSGKGAWALCRIFGYVASGVSKREFKACATAQLSGGPDAQTSVTGVGWGLGANRLAIIDPAGGRQPYARGPVQVVFNGEIYNHKALRAELRRLGYDFLDNCDGSILPALYLEYGEKFTDHLDGMYAVAILDLRASPKLVLANDHVGMKSVYHS